MIRVKIEMCPKGDESSPQEIGRMYIANTSRHMDPNRGNYDVAVCRRGTSSVPLPLNPQGLQPTRKGYVKNYPRLSYTVWRLIIRALKACFPEEEPRSDKYVGTYMDRQVGEGLRKMAQFFHYLPKDANITVDEDVQAALRWIRAGTEDPAPPDLDRPGDQ